MSVGTVVVIGGGIAGVSAAYYLAASNACDDVVLVEAEAALAHHTTGRSAALLTENYGAGPIRPLTSASLQFLHEPPADLVEQPLLTQRGILTVATEADSYGELDRQLADGQSARQWIGEIDLAQAAEVAPHVALTPDHRVMWEPHAYDIDVAALHQAFVRGLRSHGGVIRTSTRVDAARPAGDGWAVDTTAGAINADLVVNAAGAWGDVVAEGAGVAPVDLQPKKRTAFMVNSPYDDSSQFAFVAEVHHHWYLRPDGHQFMCSPADEQPSEPCDARAEELDIARTIDAINANTHLGIRAVNSHWAGLRTFGPDRSMVLGPDPGQPNFIWCVGQGGTGIQTSPGAGQLVADLVVNGEPAESFADVGLDLAALLPDRFGDRSNQR